MLVEVLAIVFWWNVAIKFDSGLLDKMF